MRAREPDPSREHFDVVDVEGNPAGEVKRRSDVHTDGDWHRAFHCWVAVPAPDGAPAVLFQRRSMNKDTHPDLLDVAVGGHYRAGEGFDEVIREIEEELGIAPAVEDLVPVGRRRVVSQGQTWLDREIQDVYVHCLKRPVASLRPSREEITAIDLIRLGDLEDLHGGRASGIVTQQYRVQPDNGLEPVHEALVDRSDFIPDTDGYFLEGSRAAARILLGETGVWLDLW